MELSIVASEPARVETAKLIDAVTEQADWETLGHRMARFTIAAKNDLALEPASDAEMASMLNRTSDPASATDSD
jgi:hypothetical protein